MAGQRRSRVTWLLALGTLALGAVLSAMTDAAAVPYAATASVAQNPYYIGDSAGSVYMLTVNNVGTTTNVGAVEISPPSAVWTVTGCPAAPSGWSEQRTKNKCRYRSAMTASDDIDPGQTGTFSIRATTAGGTANVTGTWTVVVSSSNQFDNPSLLKFASPTAPGLATTLHSFELTTAVVSTTVQTPGTACPAANKEAIIASSTTIVVCGRNRATAALTPNAANSTLGGTFVASPGTFSSGSIPKKSGNVVLGNWTGTQVSTTFGTTLTVAARIGSAANRTSPVTTFTGYSATSQPPDANDDAYSTDEDDPLVVGALVGVLANDTDPESDPITAGNASTPAHGSVSLNADGSFTYTPDLDFNGEDSFTYTANDTHSDSPPATVTITVDPVNDPPVAQDVIVSTDEDVALPVALDASDIDADALTYEIVAGPANGGAGTPVGDDVTYTPDLNYNGDDSFTYRAFDGTAYSATKTVFVTVDAVNDAPVANDDAYSVDEDEQLVVPALTGVLDNDDDVESDPLAASVVTPPAHGDLSLGADGGFTYTPDADFNGADSFTYETGDGSMWSAAPATVDLTVNPVNDLPTAQDVTDSTDEDTPKAITLDGDDVDGDTLTYAIVDGPDNGDLDTLTGDASFTYTPDADFNGADSFTYTASDASGASNVATVNVTVDPVNDAPVASGDTYDTDEDVLLTVVAPFGVLADDSDVDVDDLTAVLVDDAAHGELDLDPDGTFTYAPDANYNGTDSFTYYAYDGALSSGTVTVDITVNAVNDAPVADVTGSTGNEDTVQNVGLGGSDPVEHTALTFEVVDPPLYGTLGSIYDTACTTSCTATVDYTPFADFNGDDSFTFRTFDGTDYSDAATASLTVDAVNDAPSFTSGGDVEVVQDLGEHMFVLWAGAISKGPADESAQTLTFTPEITTVDPADLLATDPAISPTGTLTFETTFGKVGTATVSVVLADDGGTDLGGDDTSDAQVFTISVVPPNAAPVAVDTTKTMNEDSGATLITLTGTDEDDDDLAFDAGDGTHGVVSVPTTPVCNVVVNTCTSTVTYTPDANYHGADSFTFTVTDPDLEQDTGTVDVTVSSVNDQPTDIGLAGTSVAENEAAGTLVGTLSTTDVDIGDSHTYTLVSGTGSSGNASFQIDGVTLETAVPINFEANPSYLVRIRSTDSGTGALFYEESFTVTVTNVNETPTNLALSASSVPENAVAPTTVGTLSTTDPDAANTHTYTLVAGTGDDDNAAFSVVGTSLKAVASFDYEAKSSYLIRVRTTDQGSLFFDKELTVTVTNVNETPTDIGLTAQAIDENVTAPATVGTFSTTDPDAANTFTYTLVSGTGSADNASFSVVSGALKTAAAFNYEVKNSYLIRVRTTDQGGLFYDEAFTITVNDVNDAPVAVDDVFNNASGDKDAIGNTKFTVGVSGQAGPVKNVAGSARSNDTDEDALPSADTLSVTFPATTANGGTIVTGNSDGTFVYLPPAGFTGNDTFNYTLSDGQGGSDTGQVTIEVNNMVWYVNAANATAGTGRSSDPYKALSSLQGADLDETGETIFVYNGNYTTGITLEASQKLWGEPHGLSLDGVALVPAGATNPTVNSSTTAITLANDVLVEYVSVNGPTLGNGVKGTNITNATVGTGTAISGTVGGAVSLTGSATGVITVDSTITNPGGAAVTVSNRTGGSVTFTGAISDTGTGVSLTSNANTALAFTGSITTSNAGIVASGGSGTTSLTLSGVLHLAGVGSAKAFSVTGGGTVVATATDNTATTVVGRAVEITGSTTIGAGGVKFKSVTAGTAAGGPDSGIVLSGTGTAGGLDVTGTGSATSGGTIQKTTGDAISLTDTDKSSFAWMSILNAGHAGVQGTGVTDFTFKNSTVSGAGFLQNDQTDYSLAFNSDPIGGTTSNLDGVVSITNNTLSNAYGGGLQVIGRSGTITDLTVTGNTVSSTTSTTTSKGSAIALDLFGTATTVSSLTKGTISTNVITGFPSGDGIRLQGGNSASGTAPSGTYGTPTGIPGNGTNKVTISGNTIQGDATNKLNGMGISASVAGRGVGNFDIFSNGTVATPITHVKGSGIGVGGAGDVTVDFRINGNHITGTDNIAGSSALGIGTDTNIQANLAVLVNPVLRLDIQSNVITGSTGYGIYSLNRDSNGTTSLKLQNNTVNGPIPGPFSSVDITSGSSGSGAYNPTVCANVSNNTLATGGADTFGNSAPGILLDKFSTSATTYKLGLVGLSPSPATAAQTETYVAGQNPSSGLGGGFWAGKRAGVGNGDNFTSCTLGF